MVFEDVCVLVIWTKVTTVLIGSVKYAKLIYCFILHKTNIVILVQPFNGDKKTFFCSQCRQKRLEEQDIDFHWLPLCPGQYSRPPFPAWRAAAVAADICFLSRVVCGEICMGFICIWANERTICVRISITLGGIASKTNKPSFGSYSTESESPSPCSSDLK